MQLANTPPLQSTAPGLHPVSIHQTSLLVRGSKHPITAYYSIYRLQKDEKLSRPAWLVTYRNKVPPPAVEPVHVNHPSTNRARRRVTSFIRPTLLPLRHVATGTLLKWLQNFRSNRIHCTRIGSSLSDTAELISGVIQGSGIGPLLFLMYINELAKNIGGIREHHNFFCWRLSDVCRDYWYCWRYTVASCLGQDDTMGWDLPVKTVY